MQQNIAVRTHGRGFENVTRPVQACVADSGVDVGLCQVFVRHTSASLIVSENADPAVLRDLDAFMSRLAPDGDALYEHVAEGPDDMPAHVRSVLTQTSISVPVSNGRCSLGTWQGIYLWEHRHAGHHRELTVTIMGEAQTESR